MTGPTASMYSVDCTDMYILICWLAMVQSPFVLQPFSAAPFLIRNANSYTMSVVKLSLVCLAASLVEASSRILAPIQDINLPASETAEHPLEHLGANGPWFAGKAGCNLALRMNILDSQHAFQDPTFMKFLPISLKIAMSTKQHMSHGTGRDIRILVHIMAGYRCRNESVCQFDLLIHLCARIGLTMLPYPVPSRELHRIW